MRKIVFINTSYWAWGELTIAIQFAKRLKRAECLFIVPPSHESRIKRSGFEYRILIPHGKRLNRLTFSEVQSAFGPDLVILSDLLNYAFCDTHYGLTFEDLELFKCPCGGFDLYDLKKTAGKVDTFGFIDRKIKSFDFSYLSLFLQPCPILSPFTNKQTGSVRYSLFEMQKPVRKKEQTDAKNKLGINENQKIVFITNATWQQNHRLYPETIEFISSCYDSIYSSMTNLPQDIQIICVGPRRFFPTNCSKNFSHIESMPEEEFKTFISAADLLVSNNFISTSMVEVALKGIPVLLLQNSYFKFKDRKGWAGGRKAPEPAQVAALEKVYPFRMFPVGWFLFLDPIVTNNPFYSILPHIEIYDNEKITGTILSMLESTYREEFNKRIEHFKKKLVELPEPDEAIEA